MSTFILGAQLLINYVLSPYVAFLAPLCFQQADHSLYESKKTDKNRTTVQ
ncbi:hypothetical protein J2T14_004061 [Paenibacillus harenae]|nr:hypothetical protein [Paenibacillus harenae]